MSLQSARSGITTKADTSAETFALPQQLPQYIICALLGLLSGATSMALAIGLAIMAQLLLPPAEIFTPSAFLIIVTALLLGFGVSWLISRIAHRLSSNLPYHFTEPGVQVLLVFSVLTCLVQGFLFLQGM